jgi:hypothetical protein
MIGLLVSLVALLFAAAGMAVHVLRQRARVRSTPPEAVEEVADPAEATDVDPEP